jgi:Phasin protein
MSKANVHAASREQLVEAGLRAELADEILKLCRKGKVNLETIGQVPGVGPATLEQLRKLLDFRDPGVGSRADDQWARADDRARAREGDGGHGAPQQPARTAATGSIARFGVQAGPATTAAGIKTTAEETRRSADGAAELGRLLVDLVQEQIRYNFEILTRLTQATDWGQIFRIQSEYLRVSLQRGAQLTQRCLEVSQAGMAAAANTARDRVENVA